MDVSQFPGRKNSKNAGRAQDKALGTKCMRNGLVHECQFLTFLNFPPFRPPYVPNVPMLTRTGRRMPASEGGDGPGLCRRD
ncbi:unnamed protein product, partial [Staurois parvus]